MNKKEEKLLQIAEMYKYAAFTEQDREAFLDMALELKKLNKNNYCNTIIDCLWLFLNNYTQKRIKNFYKKS